MTYLHISKGSGKMLGLDSLNTDTTSIDFCNAMFNSKNPNIICSNKKDKGCYSQRMLRTFRKNCIPLFKRNLERLSNLIDWDLLPKLFTTILRINSHGELNNENHFLNVINIAKKNPDTKIVVYTKRATIVKKVLSKINRPANIILIYSNPIKDKIINTVPQFFDKVFNVITKDNKNINCYQKCKECMACYNFNDSNIIIEKIK